MTDETTLAAIQAELRTVAWQTAYQEGKVTVAISKGPKWRKVRRAIRRAVPKAKVIISPVLGTEVLEVLMINESMMEPGAVLMPKPDFFPELRRDR